MSIVKNCNGSSEFRLLVSKKSTKWSESWKLFLILAPSASINGKRQTINRRARINIERTDLGSAYDEETAGINVEDSFFVEIPRWNDFLYDFIHNGSAKLFEWYFFAMLERYDDCVNADWYASPVIHHVFAGDLWRFKIQPLRASILLTKIHHYFSRWRLRILILDHGNQK